MKARGRTKAVASPNLAVSGRKAYKARGGPTLAATRRDRASSRRRSRKAEAMKLTAPMDRLPQPSGKGARGRLSAKLNTPPSRSSRKAEASEVSTPMLVAPQPSGGKGANVVAPSTSALPPPAVRKKAGAMEAAPTNQPMLRPGGEEAIPGVITRVVSPPAAVVPKKSRAWESMPSSDAMPAKGAEPAMAAALPNVLSPAGAVVPKKARATRALRSKPTVPGQGDGATTSTASPAHGLSPIAVVSKKKVRAIHRETPSRPVPGQGEDQVSESLSPMLTVPILADVISSIRELHRERQDYHSAEKRLTLQIKSIQRRVHARTCPTPGRKKCACADLYDVLPAAAMVLSEQEASIHKHRLRPERDLRKLAEQLPVWPWVESVRGFGALSLAQIVGECGDPTRFKGPAKLWTRMGLGRYQRTDGVWERQRKAAGENGVRAQYSPTRRSIMYVIGECVIKAGGEYRAVYDVRKLYEAEKPSCEGAIASGGKCEDPKRPGHCKPGHIHNRAKRFMEKQLLRDLWREWRRAISGATPIDGLPDTTTPETQ